MAGAKKSMEDSQSDRESQGSSGVKEEIADSQDIFFAHTKLFYPSGMKNFSGTIGDEKLPATTIDLDIGMGPLNVSQARSGIRQSGMNSATLMDSSVTEDDCESRVEKHKQSERESARRWRLKKGMKNCSGTLGNAKLQVTSTDSNVGMRPLNASYASSGVGHNDMNSVMSVGSSVIDEELVRRQSQTLDDCESRTEKRKQSNKESARRRLRNQDDFTCRFRQAPAEVSSSDSSTASED